MTFLIICILIISGILAIISFKFIPFNPINEKNKQQNEVYPTLKKLQQDSVKKLSSKEKSAP